MTRCEAFQRPQYLYSHDMRLHYSNGIEILFVEHWHVGRCVHEAMQVLKMLDGAADQCYLIQLGGPLGDLTTNNLGQWLQVISE